MRRFRLESESRFPGIKPPPAKKFRFSLDFQAGKALAEAIFSPRQHFSNWCSGKPPPQAWVFPPERATLIPFPKGT